jgi:hypothetical protein
MKYFNATLRRSSGLTPKDFLHDVHCCGEDHESARQAVEDQNPDFHCQKLKAFNIAIVANDGNIAREWIRRVLAFCNPNMPRGETYAGNLNFQSLTADEAITASDFDEIHVLDCSELSTLHWQSFSDQTSCIVNLHHRQSLQPVFYPRFRNFLWSTEDDACAFWGSLYSAIGSSGALSLSWEAYARVASGYGIWRGKVVQGTDPITATRLLVQGLAHQKTGQTVLSIAAPQSFTMGDLVKVDDAVTEGLPMERKTLLTVWPTGARQNFGLSLLWFSPEWPSANSVTIANPPVLPMRLRRSVT